MKPKLRAFKVEPDVNRYQYFLWDIERAPSGVTYDTMACGGSPKGKKWKPAPVYIHAPRHKRGDFWSIGLGGGGLGIAPWAFEKVEALHMFAEMAGELLPVRYQEQTFMLLNITECIECLDPERSKWFPLPDGKRTMLTPFLRADRMVSPTEGGAQPAVAYDGGTERLPKRLH